jgi:transcriptional regulator with XRE-family HTH domain
MARSTHHRHYQAFLGLLRELRERAGLSQTLLGERLGNTQTFVSKMERGERRVDIVEFTEICEALDADPVTAFREFLRQRNTVTESSGRKLSVRPATSKR